MKAKKIILISVMVISIGYGSYLLKKAFFDKGYSSEEQEKEMLLTNYLIVMGIPDTPANRRKYRNVSLAEIKKELGIEN
jgi:hypothetical protein